MSLCLLLPCSAQLQAEDFRVNDDFTGTYQGYSHIATDLDGNFVVSWYDKRAGQNDIFVQFFDRVGNRLGGNRLVNDDAASAEQLKPSLIRSQTGECFVAWQDYRITGYPFNGDIYLQRFDATTNPVGANERVNGDFGVSTQAWQDIAVADNGLFVVVWEDNRNGGYDIYAQRYNADGSKAGNNIRVNDDFGNAYQHNPKVAIAADGKFVVTWYDNRSGNDNIMAQRYSSAGEAQGLNFNVSEFISGNKCVSPDIACDAEGNFTVAWIDYRNGNYPENPDVYGRMFWADGNARSNSFKINTDGNSDAQAEVTIGMDYSGNFITAWRDDRDGDFDIYAQYFNQSGSKVGTNYKVNSDDGAATQSFPNVTLDGINIYYTWTDDRNGNFDIYASITGYGAPALVVTPKNLEFVSDGSATSPQSLKVQVRNIGYGILEWNASPSVDWISVTPQSGTAPDSFEVTVSALNLGSGMHAGKIFISDVERAVADSIEVSLEVNQPLASFCASSQNVAFVSRVDGQASSDSIVIDNCGDAGLVWSVAELPAWLALSVDSGVEGDTLYFNISDTLLSGEYIDTLWLQAVQCDNSPYPLEVSNSVYPSDSLWLEPAQTLRGTSIEVPLHLTNYIPAATIELSMMCESGIITLDSLEVETVGGTLISHIKSMYADTLTALVEAVNSIPEGDAIIALLHMTATDSAYDGNHFIEVEATVTDTLGFESLVSGVAGEVSVSSQTDVRPVAGQLPTEAFLAQNYPNPFNLSTTVTYGISSATNVSLDCWNVINLQISGVLMSWDGRDSRGVEVASGIYFIRMTTEESSFVVKAVLLK